MERHSCSMPCLTKAWRRTLPNAVYQEYVLESEE